MIEKITKEDVLNAIYNKTLDQYVQNLVSQEEIKDMKDHEVYGIIQSPDGQQQKLRVGDMRTNISATLQKLEIKLKAINTIREKND